MNQAQQDLDGIIVSPIEYKTDEILTFVFTIPHMISVRDVLMFKRLIEKKFRDTIDSLPENIRAYGHVEQYEQAQLQPEKKIKFVVKYRKLTEDDLDTERIEYFVKNLEEL